MCVCVCADASSMGTVLIKQSRKVVSQSFRLQSMRLVTPFIIHYDLGPPYGQKDLDQH